MLHTDKITQMRPLQGDTGDCEGEPKPEVNVQRARFRDRHEMFMICGSPPRMTTGSCAVGRRAIW